MDILDVVVYICKKGMKRCSKKQLERLTMTLKPSPYCAWAREELERRKKEKGEKRKTIKTTFWVSLFNKINNFSGLI